MVGFGWWHDFIAILAQNPVNEFALLGIARNKGKGLDSILANIQSEIGFPRFTVRSMAEETVVGQDGTDVSVEVDCFGFLGIGSVGLLDKQRRSQG